MATVRVVHRKVTGAPANPRALVDGPGWDDTHIVEGLESVDNTSDINKPVSAAQGTAIAAAVAAVTATSLGLGNVNNTSDANKPVSTAQAAAIALKADVASPTFSGVPAAPTAAPGTNTTQLATTAFAQAGASSAVQSAAGTATPAQAASAAVVGTGTKWAREDHVHPLGLKGVNRLADINSAKDANAVGNGVTDDSTPLQTVFSNTSNVGWDIPAGIYKFATGIISDYGRIQTIGSVTGAPGAITFNLTGHGYANGTTVFLSLGAAGVFPTLFGGYPNLYYVVNSAANTFQLSLTNGGAAITSASNGSGVVYVSASYTIVGNSQSGRAHLRGASMSNTILRYSGTGYAITLLASLTSYGLDAREVYSDFMLENNALSLGSNNGIYVLNRAQFKFDNVSIQYFQSGLTLDACYDVELSNVQCMYNATGLSFLVTSATPGQQASTAVNASDCVFKSNSSLGVGGIVTTNVKFDGCDISSNGTTGHSGDTLMGGVQLNLVLPTPGPITFDNCYFELNTGYADIFIANTSGLPATVIVRGCIFARGNASDFTTYNINVVNSGAGSTTKVILEGNSFYSDLTRYTPSSARPFFSGDLNTEFVDLGNSYSENTSRPNLPCSPAAGGVPATHGRVTGGSVDVSAGAIALATTRLPPQVQASRSSAGVYVLTHNSGWAKDVNSYFITATSLGGGGGLKVERIDKSSATVFVVVITNSAGTPTDQPFMFQVLQLG